MADRRGAAEDRERAGAQIAINAMWAKGAAALGIPFLIVLVGLVFATAADVRRIEASTTQLRTDVTGLQTPPAQIREEERRWAQILGGINDRLGRIETQLQIQSPPRP
jgi:hypothetical protein